MMRVFSFAFVSMFVCSTVVSGGGADGTPEIIGAARNGDLERVEALLEADPSVATVRGASGYTALHWAAIRDHESVALRLLKAGAPVDVIGADGDSLLHWACHHDRPDLVAAMLDAGADVGLVNRWGRTPLHTAARRGCIGVMALLLERGASVNAVTHEGWTALHVAEKAGHPEAAAVLRAAGADEVEDGEGNRPSELRLVRPDALDLAPENVVEVIGEYDLGGAVLTVWMENGELRAREFAPDALDPVGPDTYLCRAEPWTIRFVRNLEGEVDGVEIDFLRRTVTGAKLESRLEYVGSGQCRSCHAQGKDGGEYIAWLRSGHASAYWRLATDWAQFLASRRDEYSQVTAPIEEPRCLACHTVGGHEGDPPRGDGLRVEQGVGCESCHGPGSAYLDPGIMADRARFLANGGRIPDQTVCVTCHRDEHFDFEERRPKIRHW
jgi:hypothetical protein